MGNSFTPRRTKTKHKSERWDFCTNRENCFFFPQLFLVGFRILPCLALATKNVCVFAVLPWVHGSRLDLFWGQVCSTLTSV